MEKNYYIDDSVLNHLKLLPIQKNIKSSLYEIDQFNENLKGKLSFVDEKRNNDEDAELTKIGNKFKINFVSNADYQKYGEYISSVKFTLNTDNIYYSDDALVTNISFPPFFKYEVSISNIYKGNKSNYYRIALPLTENLSFNRLFDCYNFCFDKSSCCSELIRTYIDGKEFHIFKIKNYLFIDCLADIDFDSFYNQAICILCALGVLTGCFVENECFILSSSNNEFDEIEYIEFKSLRKSIFSTYNILPTNPYMFFSSDIAQRKQKTMAHINTDVFTVLVNKIYLSLPLENTLFVFLEALSYPLDTQPICLSVVLEGLCNYIKDNDEKSFLPIPDKGVAKKLRKEMKSLLNNYSAFFSPDGKEIIEKRIADINSPTNRGKFEKAIEMLGLNLSDYEKQMLSKRNVFLHGRIDLETAVVKKNAPYYVKPLFSSQVLIRLLYKMILKIIGYEGVITNILKYNEDVIEIIKDEPWLIKI